MLLPLLLPVRLEVAREIHLSAGSGHGCGSKGHSSATRQLSLRFEAMLRQNSSCKAANVPHAACSWALLQRCDQWMKLLNSGNSVACRVLRQGPVRQASAPLSLDATLWLKLCRMQLIGYYPTTAVWHTGSATAALAPSGMHGPRVHACIRARARARHARHSPIGRGHGGRKNAARGASPLGEEQAA